MKKTAESSAHLTLIQAMAAQQSWRLHPGHSGQDVLQALNSRSKKTSELLKLLLIDWPAAGIVISSLAYYVTDGLELGDTGVLYQIIEDSLLFYGVHLFYRHGRKGTDAARIGAFVSRIVSSTCALVKLKIVEPITGRSWSLAGGEPLSQWNKDTKGEILIQPQLDTDDVDMSRAREVLYQAITPETLKETLRRSRYEKDVVDGRMGAPLGVVGGTDPDSGAVDAKDHRP